MMMGGDNNNNQFRLEINTAHASYKLSTNTEEDQKKWYNILKERIELATENDLMRLAEFMIGDSERSRSRRDEGLLRYTASTFEGFMETDSGTEALVEFARRIGMEYEVLYYLDIHRACDEDVLATLSPADVGHLCSRFLELEGGVRGGSAAGGGGLNGMMHFKRNI